MSKPAPEGFSHTQIVLHWIVAALMIFQIVGHEGMEHAYHAFHRGEAAAAFDYFLAQAHVASGAAIWLFALWRLKLRFSRGVPELPAGEPEVLKKLAGAVVVILYLCMLAMPLSGAAAWFGGVDLAGEIHGLARFVLLPAILVHVAGALAQHFWFRSDVLRRMVRASA